MIASSALLLTLAATSPIALAAPAGGNMLLTAQQQADNPPATGRLVDPFVRDDPQRFNRCLDLAVEDAPAAIVEANGWIGAGGGYLASHCLGFAQSQLGRWDQAAKAFADAAEQAEKSSISHAANLWTQAGNAALANGDATLALRYLDAALEHEGEIKKPLLKGELHLDKARALVLLQQYDLAWREFEIVHRLVPEDPLGWLLSATLARRMGNMERAGADINVALELAPKDTEVLLEAGNVAWSLNDNDAARRYWTQAQTSAAGGPLAPVIAERLELLNSSASQQSAATSGENPPASATDGQNP